MPAFLIYMCVHYLLSVLFLFWYGIPFLRIFRLFFFFPTFGFFLLNIILCINTQVNLTHLSPELLFKIYLIEKLFPDFITPRLCGWLKKVSPELQTNFQGSAVAISVPWNCLAFTKLSFQLYVNLAFLTVVWKMRGKE